MQDKCKYCGMPLIAKEYDIMGDKKRIMVHSCDCLEKKEKSDEAQRELKKKQDKISQLFSISSLGEKFQKRTFGNWQSREGTENAFYACKSMVVNFRKGKGLLIVGGTGNGKTHLAAAVVNKFNDKDNKECIPSVFLNMSEFFILVEGTYRKSENKTSLFEILETIKCADVVVLNDLGKEKWTSKRIDVLFTLIEILYNHEISVIITMNPQALREMEKNTQADLNAKDKETLNTIIDRIYEMCKGNVIQNTASSFRKENFGEA